MFKIKQGFALKTVAGNNMVVPLGKTSEEFNGIIHLNESGTLLWQLLSQGATKSELLKKLLEEYEIDEATAQNDIDKFIALLSDKNLIEN